MPVNRVSRLGAAGPKRFLLRNLLRIQARHTGYSKTILAEVLLNAMQLGEMLPAFQRMKHLQYAGVHCDWHLSCDIGSFAPDAGSASTACRVPQRLSQIQSIKAACTKASPPLSLADTLLVHAQHLWLDLNTDRCTRDALCHLIDGHVHRS